MLILVYTLLSLSFFKIIVDLYFGEVMVIYSIFLENVIFGVILAMIIRTHYKQKEGRKEKLQERYNELSKSGDDIK
jgi:hypothetical protein